MLKTKPKIEFIENEDRIRFEGIFIIKSLWEEDEQLLIRIKDFLKDRSKVHLEFKIFYLDSVSRKIFFELLMDLSSSFDKMEQVDIDWYYEEEDESILELGRLLNDNLSTEFNFILQD